MSRSWSRSEINIFFDIEYWGKKQIECGSALIVLTLIDNDIRHHSGQNVVDAKAQGKERHHFATISHRYCLRVKFFEIDSPEVFIIEASGETKKSESNRRMTKWAVIECVDLLFVSAVFARSTHPELIFQQWTAAHNASRELYIAVWTNLTPV